MRIAHEKEKSVNVMGNVTNAGNIMQSLNVRDLFIVKKRKRNDEWRLRFLKVSKKILAK